MNEDNCEPDFTSLSREELESLASQMHDDLHRYHDQAVWTAQRVVSVGYALDAMAEDVRNNDVLGKRAQAMHSMPQYLDTFAGLLYSISGVTPGEVAAAVFEQQAFADIVSNLEEDPEFNKE